MCILSSVFTTAFLAWHSKMNLFIKRRLQPLEVSTGFICAFVSLLTAHTNRLSRWLLVIETQLSTVNRLEIGAQAQVDVIRSITITYSGSFVQWTVIVWVSVLMLVSGGWRWLCVRARSATGARLTVNDDVSCCMQTGENKARSGKSSVSGHCKRAPTTTRLLLLLLLHSWLLPQYQHMHEQRLQTSEDRLISVAVLLQKKSELMPMRRATAWA